MWDEPLDAHGDSLIVGLVVTFGNRRYGRWKFAVVEELDGSFVWLRLGRTARFRALVPAGWVHP